MDLCFSKHASLGDSLWIDRKVVGHYNVNVLRDVLFNVLCQRAGLYILRVEEPQIAAALPDANDDFFR